MENLSFRIQNKGTVATSETFVTELSFDGIRLSLWEHTGLCAGCSASGGIDVTVNGAGDHAVAARVDVDDAISEVSEANNSYSETWIWHRRRADMSVAIAGLPDPIDAGQRLTYDLALVNIGPLSATSVIVTDTLPAALSYQSAVSSQGQCFHRDSTITCALGDIEAESTAQISIEAQVSLLAQGTIRNSVYVSASEPDPDTTNNSATVETVIREVVEPEYLFYVPVFYSSNQALP
jgi:uncharacterized repeat protein (TIGR01451 family)